MPARPLVSAQHVPTRYGSCLFKQADCIGYLIIQSNIVREMFEIFLPSIVGWNNTTLLLHATFGKHRFFTRPK